MVHIINGEIVADDDPRVKAKQHGGATQRRPTGGFGGVGGAPPQVAPPAPAGAAASPLQGLARSIGLEGAVTIPAVSLLGLPARPVEKIHLAVAALLVFFFGWRALAFIAFAYFLSLQGPPRTAAPVAGPAPPRHGGGPTSPPGSNVRTL